MAGSVVSAHSDHEVGRRETIAPGRSGRPMPHRSDSAAGTVSLQRLGFCIAGLKQPSARRVETTEAVAKRRREAGGCDCCSELIHRRAGVTAGACWQPRLRV